MSYSQPETAGEFDDGPARHHGDTLTGSPRGPKAGEKVQKRNQKRARVTPFKREKDAVIAGLGPVKMTPIEGCALGAEVPRVFTPPLRELTPETSKGFECIAFLEDTLKWSLTPYQRWLYIHALELRPGTDQYRFDTILIVIARQNGKTKWLQGLALWRLFRDGAELVVTSAQILDYAEGNLREGVLEIQKHKPLMRDWVKYYETNGKHKLRLSDNREWRAVPANRRAARSLSVDLAVIDELREHQNFDAWNAITPTTTARPRSLVVTVSNAGDATSVVLNNLQDKAAQRIATGSTADTRTFMAEYSVAPDADPFDRSLWPQANPALGWLFDEGKLEGFLESQPTIEGFKTEHLCMRVEVLEPGCLDYNAWAKLADNKSKIAADADIHWAVDVSWDRKRACIGVVGQSPSGQLHAEIVQAGPGVAWVKKWLRERKLDPDHPFDGRIAIQTRGAPSAALADELQAELTDPADPDSDPLFDVAAWTGAELAKSAGVLADFIDQGVYSHLDQPILNEAVRVVQAKISGDAWYLDRRKSLGDASPVCAICAATWLSTQPREVETVSAYASGDFVML